MERGRRALRQRHGSPGRHRLERPYTIDVSGGLNSPNALKVEGLELTVQQTFDFLAVPSAGRRVQLLVCPHPRQGRDEYDLPGGGTFAGNARSVKARGQFDLSASYKISPQLSLAVDAFNVNNTFREEFEGSYTKPRRTDFEGRTIQASLRYTFF